MIPMTVVKLIDFVSLSLSLSLFCNITYLEFERHVDPS
jgi:hypothetical protein